MCTQIYMRMPILSPSWTVRVICTSVVSDLYTDDAGTVLSDERKGGVLHGTMALVGMEKQVYDFLARSITESTGDQYSPKWKRWVQFVEGLSEEAYAGLYLERWDGDPRAVEERLACLLRFMEWLYSEGGLRTEQVKGVMTAVNTTMTLAGHTYTGLFDHPLIIRAKRACLRSVEEQRVYQAEKEGRKKLGVCVSMVWKMRSLAWLGSDCLVRKATWVSVGLGYDLASRASQVTQPDGPKALDHNTRTGDLMFTVRDGSSSKKVRGGEDLRAYLLSERRSADNDVFLVDIGTPTDKGMRLRKGQTSLEPRPIMRRSELESLFLTDLCDWIVMSGRRWDQPLAGRWNTKCNRDKVITKKELTNLIKESAVALGLPAKSFSSKSMRSGCATTMASADDVKDEEINHRGGWVKDSDIPQKYYISRVQGRGPMAIGGSGYGIEEVKRLLPAV
jgi:hypothetical protein